MTKAKKDWLINQWRILGMRPKAKVTVEDLISLAKSVKELLDYIKEWEND